MNGECLCNWKKIELGKLVEIKYGKDISTKELKSIGYPVFGANGVIGFYSQYLYEEEQVLISCRGAYSGKINLSPPKCFVTHNSLVLGHLREEILIKRFLFYALQAIDKTKMITGSAQPQVTINNAKTLEVPIPPLHEQRRIVAKLEKLLEKVEASRTRLEKIPAILKRFRQSVLAAACSGRLTADWRQENSGVPYAEGLYEGEPPGAYALPESWNWISSSKLFTYVTSGSRGWAKYYTEEGAVFLRVGNLDHDSIKLDLRSVQYVSPPRNAEGRRTKVERGDILISITADVGMVALVEDEIEEAYINQHIALARPANNIDRRYLAYYLTCEIGGQEQFRNLQRGMTKSGLGLDDIRSIWVPGPPLPEQYEIVRRVEELFALADRIENRYQKAKAHVVKLTQSLLAKAFRGELVPQDPNDEPASELLKRIKAQEINHEHPKAKTRRKKIKT
jgi:type I restriction enzyme S subunit